MTYKERLLDRSREEDLLIKFHATWCNPCKKMAPILDNLLQEYDHLELLSIDIDQSLDVAREFEVMSVPTLILLSGGEEVDRVSGAMSENDLRGFLDQ